jgi:membrane fusion protein (multidrug efflux system)
LSETANDSKTSGSNDSNHSNNPDRDQNNDHGDQDQNNEKEGDKDKDEPPKKRSLWLFIIAAIIIVVALVAFLVYWLATAGEVTTDDAYTDGTAVSIAANVSGYATELYVNDNSFVHAGDLLLIIDPRADQAALQQAQANLALAQSQLASAQINVQETQVKAPAQLQQAQAQLVQAQAQEFQTRRNYDREVTVDSRATARTDIDQAYEQLRAAQASVKQAQAQVDSASLIPQQLASAQSQVQQQQAQVAQAQANLVQAQTKLSYNEIRAPQDGWITMRNVDLGTYVQSGQQIFYIVSPRYWVTANFKETQLADIHPGDHVRMTIDAYPKIVLFGHVQSIQAGSGARFTTFPVENATGNFVKIVRRVPVKIVIDSTKPSNIYGLPLGISVEPTVDVQ